MTQRERLLAIGVGLLIVLWGGWQGWTAYSDAVQRRIATRDRLADELHDQEMEVLRGRKARRRLLSLQERSLPTDANIARSAYADWLKDAIRDAGLELDSVRAVSTRRYAEAATELTFTAVASGPPEAFVRLLDAYYRLDTLHQLTNLQLRPVDESGEEWRVVSFTSAALVVDGALREEGLPSEPRTPPRLRLDETQQYVDSVVGRNLFASYTPPPPPRPDPPKVVSRPKPSRPDPPSFDDAKHAKLTGIAGGDRLQAWVLVRTTGEQLRLTAGDTFEVGQLQGTVKAVRRGEMVVESDAGVWTASIGDMLREAADRAESGS